jgi:hypothetical protein
MHPYCYLISTPVPPWISGRTRVHLGTFRGPKEEAKTFVPSFAEARHKFSGTPSHFRDSDPVLIINLPPAKGVVAQDCRKKRTRDLLTVADE